MSNIKVEKNKKPQGHRKHPGQPVYPFDTMKEGDSFYYEGPRSGPIIAFGYRSIRGKFSTEKEVKKDEKGNIIRTGWRFFMWKDPSKSE